MKFLTGFDLIWCMCICGPRECQLMCTSIPSLTRFYIVHHFTLVPTDAAHLLLAEYVRPCVQLLFLQSRWERYRTEPVEIINAVVSITWMVQQILTVV